MNRASSSASRARPSSSANSHMARIRAEEEEKLRKEAAEIMSKVNRGKSNRALSGVAERADQREFNQRWREAQARKESGSLSTASLLPKMPPRAPHNFSSHIGRNALNLIPEESIYTNYRRGGYAKAVKPKPVAKRVAKPVAKRVAKPVAKRVVKPVAKRVVKPVAKRA